MHSAMDEDAAGILAGASEDFSLNAWRAVTGIVLDGANWLRRSLRMPVFEPVRT